MPSWCIHEHTQIVDSSGCWCFPFFPSRKLDTFPPTNWSFAQTGSCRKASGVVIEWCAFLFDFLTVCSRCFLKQFLISFSLLAVGAGASEGGMDAANILKPLLARGSLKMLGATTPEEYRAKLEPDTALARRLQASVTIIPVQPLHVTCAYLKRSSVMGRSTSSVYISPLHRFLMVPMWVHTGRPFVPIHNL